MFPGSAVRYAALAFVCISGGFAQNYLHTRGREIVDSSNQTVRLTGVNWFGLETTNFVPHGLWTRSMGSMFDQIRDLGYNTIRVPFSNQLFDSGSTPNGIDFNQNPDLAGLTGVQILDKLVSGARARGLKIILDRHRPDAYGQSELWYTSAYPEARWISDWKMLASRYAGNGTVVGFDLHNEPHGRATWGDNNVDTDWRLAAERAGNAILAINPKLLIIVEGIERVGNDYYWWGGNLSSAGANPVRLNVLNQLVYSAHDYPESVYGQSWFYASNYPSNLPGIWENHWGYLMTANSAPVLMGEFGTKYQTTKDQQWLQTMANFIASRGMNFTYWSWNPNSGDTGGILNDDWRTVNTQKQAILQPLLAPMIGTGGSTPAPTTPSTPTGVVATPGNQQVSLSWSPSTGATSYNIYRSLSSGAQGSTANATVAGTSFVDSSLTNGTTYYYRVTAVNSVGESTRSIEVSATPTAGPTPTIPTGVSATAGDRQATLQWSPSNGATTYNVYRGISSGGQGASPYRTGLTTNSFSDTGLTNGTTYFYRITALNAAGESARSAEVSALPAAATSENITAVGRVAPGFSPWYGELDVLLTNGAPLTALTIEITVQKTPGVTYSGQYNAYWGNMLSMSSRQTATSIIYSYVLNAGQTVPAGSNWLTAAQLGGNGTLHPTSGDTFTVSAASGGVVRVVTGTF
jgi:aryl-phospho-beta-D-glucosidase BglC (GH1 family)